MSTDVILFLFFSIAAAFVYRHISIKTRRSYLLAVNAVFYLLCDARFLLLLAISILWSWECGEKIRRTGKRGWLIAGIAAQVLVLFFFKYGSFFAYGLSDSRRLIMPIGLSYYSFRIISYLADTYKGEIYDHKLVDYAIYTAFFPQIICGPINRTQSVTDNLDTTDRISPNAIAAAAFYIMSGLFKKLVIADRVGLYVNTVFKGYGSYPSLALWTAAFFYAVQLYCDFAGYSEIVMGISMLFGFNCVENFRMPYFSGSIKEFWNRWHISLSDWLRDYIYIPLGGNRKGSLRRVLNVLVVFLVSGIWHGNSLNFIVWGLIHGILNVLSPKNSKNRLVRGVQTIGTFTLVTFSWLFFRLNTLADVAGYVKAMFSNMTISYNTLVASVMPFTGDYSCVSYMLTSILFIGVLFVLELRQYNGRKVNMGLRFGLFMAGFILFGMVGSNSFIYANF